jgi:hypothetical protein
MANEPQSPRRGSLKNGNPPGDFRTAARCGAKTRRGTSCQCPGMRTNGRCRIHGGLSTGPKTAEGIERIRQSRTKHGVYSQAWQAQMAKNRETRRKITELIRILDRGGL